MTIRRNLPVHLAFLATVLLSLSGCGAIRQAQLDQAHQQRQAEITAADNEASAATKACHDKLEKGELPNHVAFANCANDKVTEIYQRANYPNQDLIAVASAARLVGAEKIDSNQATEGEVKMQMAELLVRLNNESRRRDLEAMQARNQAAYANAAQEQARAANTAASGSFLEGLAALQPKPAKVTNCSGLGNMVTCTSN